MNDLKSGATDILDAHPNSKDTSLKIVFENASVSLCMTLDEICLEPNRILNCGTPVMSKLISKGVIDAAGLSKLIDAGADITLRDNNGNLPLFFAVLYNREPLFDMLMTRGGAALVNLQQDGRADDISLLHVAASNGNMALAKKLIAADAYLNAIDSHADTPLTDAVRKLNPSMVRLLVDAGADVAKYEELTGKSLTAIADRAAIIERKRPELDQIIELLVDAGAQPLAASHPLRRKLGAVA